MATPTALNIVRSSIKFNNEDFDKCIKCGWKEIRFEGKRALANGKTIFIPSMQKKNN